MILIITSKTDGHIEPVTRHLDAAGMRWIRLNTEDIARNLEAAVIPTIGQGKLRLRDSGREIDLERVRAVWYRKPEPVDVSHFELDRGACDYVEAEFREILDGVYALLSHVSWINNPLTTRLAHRKMLQLRVATNVGFKTPRTIVTNDVDAALGFASEIGSDLAIKSLGSLHVTEDEGGQAKQYGIFTRRINRTELEEVKDKIRYLPTTFQEFVQKRYELRVTCVGRQMFACRIESRPGDLTADDYRFDTKNLNHVACECPDLHVRLQAYMQEFGIKFACFDFIVSLVGDIYFLEANANGQWLWVEHLTGLPIGKAIADELMASCRETP
jgi:glutathione synthase/RimK-type ligase-like ATP-grasp enzyme